MDITITREALLAGMAPLAPMIGRNAGLRLAVTGDRLEITAGDEQAELRTQTLCQTARDGSVLFRNRSFLEFVRQLDDGKTIRVQDSGDQFIRATGEGINYKFAQLPDSDFKTYKHEGSVEVLVDVTLSAEQFQQYVRKVSYTAAKDDARHLLNGVLFHFVGDTLVLVATNGHALALHELEHAGKAPDDAKFVVPIRHLQEIIKLATAREDGQTRLRFTESAVRADAPDGAYKTHLLGRDFVDYAAVVPSHKDTVEVSTAELLEAVSRAKLMCVKDTDGIRINVNRGGVLVMSGKDGEECREEVGASSVIEEVKIAFNPAYVINALKSVTTETAVIAMGGSMQAVLIRDPTSAMRQVIMPVRI